jgi:hypothetical protein
MEARGCSQVENACPKEDTGGEHRPNPETDRGRYSAKGIQSRIIARFAFLIRQARATPGNFKPARPHKGAATGEVLTKFGEHAKLLDVII